MRGEGGKGKRAWKSKKKTKKRELMSAKIIQHQGQLSLQFTHSAIKRKQCSLYIRWSLMRLRLFNVCLLLFEYSVWPKKDNNSLIWFTSSHFLLSPQESHSFLFILNLCLICTHTCVTCYSIPYTEPSIWAF